MLNLDIVREATRLTRAGKLVEATALLQRMLRRKGPLDTTLPGRISATSAQPRMLRALLDRTKERSAGAQSERPD